MRFLTFFAILIGLTLILLGFLDQGLAIKSVFSPISLLIVIGGTLSAGIAGSNKHIFKYLPKVLRKAFSPEEINARKLIDKILELAVLIRKDGILSVESANEKIEHPFLKKLLLLSIDGADKQTMKELVDAEIDYLEQRHSEYINFFERLGAYSPTFGIIGTVIGLIAALSSGAEDPTEVITHIGTAFITTFWGILFANLVWLPIADKLKSLHNDEIRLYQVIFEGVHSILKQDNSAVIEAKLSSYFPSKDQEDINKGYRDLVKQTIRKSNMRKNQ